MNNIFNFNSTNESGTMSKSLNYFIFTIFFLLLSSFSASANSWEDIRKTAKGQTVYWNAWGGSEEINAYISWVGSRVKEDHGVTLKHVKLASTADAVSRVLAEKAAGRSSNGSVDLIWINGENFAKMKENGLLFGPLLKICQILSSLILAENQQLCLISTYRLKVMKHLGGWPNSTLFLTPHVFPKLQKVFRNCCSGPRHTPDVSAIRT